jgi:hypothetical protein
MRYFLSLYFLVILELSNDAPAGGPFHGWLKGLARGGHPQGIENGWAWQCLVTLSKFSPILKPFSPDRNFPCQTLKISKVSLVVMWS